MKTTLLMTALSFLLGFTILNVPNVADDALPPRPTLVPTALPTTVPTPTTTPVNMPTPETPSTTSGGLIILQASEQLSADVITIVQWQSTTGDWYDVKGWRGEFNKDKQVVWWVAPENFAEEPFRWVVLQGDEVLFVSEAFVLPGRDGEIETIILP